MQRRVFISGLGVALGTVACTPAPQRQAPATDSDSRLLEGRLLDAEALEDTLLGSSLMGCGGGGSLSEARELIASDLAQGLEFRQLDVADLDDSEMVASSYALESLAPMSQAMQERMSEMPRVDSPAAASFGLLEEFLERKFAAVIIGEIGPLSMAEGLSLAARIGVASLDADTVGRATPEINQHSVRVAGHDITPAAAVTLFGDEVILRNVSDSAREEEIFRALSRVSRLVGVTDAAISGAVAKAEHVLVQASLSRARAIGRAVREARAGGDDPVEAARLAGNGYLLFEGTVSDFEWSDLDGFLVGAVSVAGSGAFAGSRLELEYKNEHLVARRDDKVIATCPDLITLVDKATGEGIGNPEFERGQKVATLAYRAPELWRRPAGLAVFSPRYFGFDLDYVPVEARIAGSEA